MRTRLFVALTLLLALPTVGRAWNYAGHRVIASTDWRLRQVAASLPMPPAPGKSLPVTAVRVGRSFISPGATTVVLRAEAAGQATVVVVPRGEVVNVSGLPQGGAAGYHPPDPNWRETPPSQWGLDFRARRFGRTLVISTFNEITYIHHHYAFDQISIAVPEGVKVIKEDRNLTGDGAADLSPPRAQ